MIFHLGFELPEAPSKDLDHESPDLTQEEVRILKKQIRANALLINQFIDRLELFIHQEGYPRGAVFIEKIRRRLELLMEENDTFRRVLWKHMQTQELVPKAR